MPESVSGQQTLFSLQQYGPHASPVSQTHWQVAESRRWPGGQAVTQLPLQHSSM
jgi:hypothetical protein